MCFLSFCDSMSLFLVLLCLFMVDLFSCCDARPHFFISLWSACNSVCFLHLFWSFRLCDLWHFRVSLLSFHISSLLSSYFYVLPWFDVILCHFSDVLLSPAVLSLCLTIFILFNVILNLCVPSMSLCGCLCLFKWQITSFCPFVSPQKRLCGCFASLGGHFESFVVTWLSIIVVIY